MNPVVRGRSSHLHLGRSVSIIGTGSYLPEKVLTNADLSKMVDTSDEWIMTRTGIRERHIAAPTQASSDLGAEAARRALAQAGIKPETLDLIITATITPDMLFPSTSCYVQKALGAMNAACFDVSAACSGFIFGLEIGRQFVASGTANTVLVIGTEKLSGIVDWEDRGTCVLFGDGAGAAVLQHRPGQRGILTSVMASDGTLSHLLQLPGGGSRNPTSEKTIKERLHYLKMSGRDVFKHAVGAMVDAAKRALDRCGLTIDQINCIIPHQANIRIVAAIGDRLGAPLDKYYLNLERCGNMSAATIPVALDEAVRRGVVKKHDLVLMMTFGGGFTWGATVVEW